MTSLQISSPINCRPGSFNSVSTSSPARLLWSEVHKYFFSFVNCLLCWQCRNNVLSFFPYLPSRRSIWWSTFQKNRELFTKVKILLMSMTESAHWTQKHELLQILHGSCFRNKHSWQKWPQKPLRFWSEQNQPCQPASRPAQFPSNSFAQFQRLLFESSSKNAFCQWVKSCLPLFLCCTRRKGSRRRRTSLSNCFQRRRDWIEKWAWRKRVSTLKKMKKLPGWSIRTWVWIFEVLVSAPPAQVAEDEVVPDVHSDQVGRVERGTVPSRSWHLL